MVKPICLIYFPPEYSFYPDGRIIQPMDLMKELNGWRDRMTVDVNFDAYGGYLYWCFLKEGITEPEMQVFNGKLTKKEFKELKEIVEKGIQAAKLPHSPTISTE